MPRRAKVDPNALAIGQRIRTLRERAGFKLERFAFEHDRSKGHQSDIENGRVDATIGTLSRIAERLGVDVIDLLIDPSASPRHALIARSRLARRAQIDAALEALPEEAPSEPFARVRSKIRGAVPLLAYEIAAGPFRSARMADKIEWVVPHMGRRAREGMFVARIQGDSMEPRLGDGSYALFDAKQTAATHGGIVLVERGASEGSVHAAEYLVKTFDRGPPAKLIASNRRKYPPIPLGPGEPVRIIATLVTELPER